MNKQQKEFLKALNGEEILLYPYGAVMIENNTFIYMGEKHKIDSSNYEEIHDAFIMQEYGTMDLMSIIKMEGF